MKIMINPDLRRSPRLNPPPRRSPRIKSLASNPGESIEPSPAANEGGLDENEALLRPRRPASVDKRPHTPGRKESPTKSASAKKVRSAVKFGRNTMKVVQRFDGSDPPNKVRRASLGKRLFVSLEGVQGRAKRSKNDTLDDRGRRNERVVVLAKALIVLGTVIVAGAVSAFVGNIAMKW